MEDLGISTVTFPTHRLRQTATTAVRVWFNYDLLGSFKSKREARDFIEKFFHENLPIDASVPFKREMLSGLTSILLNI